jgi:DNA-binding ferritin-like protein
MILAISGSLEPRSGPDAVGAIAARLAAYAGAVRTAIDTAVELHDQTTIDLFTEVSCTTDKHLWFVEAHRH